MSQICYRGKIWLEALKASVLKVIDRQAIFYIVMSDPKPTYFWSHKQHSFEDVLCRSVATIFADSEYLRGSNVS